MKYLFIVSLLLVGCATTPPPASEIKMAPANRLLAFQDKTKDVTATLVVTRDQGLIGGGCYKTLTIDSKLSARLDTSERANFYLQPGEHLLKVGVDEQGEGLCAFTAFAPWTQRETILRAGETKYFRITTDPNGITDISRAD